MARIVQNKAAVTVARIVRSVRFSPNDPRIYEHARRAIINKIRMVLFFIRMFIFIIYLREEREGR